MTTPARIARYVVSAFTTALIMMAFASAEPAHAGTFEVSACDAAPGFANNSWRPEATHGGMVTYLACPAGDDARFGLGARHQEQPSGYTVPTGAAARRWFDAPPGTAVVGIRANGLFEQFHHGWQVGLSNGSQLLEGCPSTGTSTGGVCVGSMYAADSRPVPPSSVIYTEVFCAIGPCPAGGAGKFWARGSLTYVAVTVADDIPPTLGSVGGDLWTDRWVAGTRQVSFDAADNTGIKQVRVVLDGMERAGASRGCDPTAKSATQGSTDSSPVRALACERWTSVSWTSPHRAVSGSARSRTTRRRMSSLPSVGPPRADPKRGGQELRRDWRRLVLAIEDYRAANGVTDRVLPLGIDHRAPERDTLARRIAQFRRERGLSLGFER